MYHYSLITGELVPNNTSGTADYLSIYNYDPQKVSDPEDVPPPPYNKLEIHVFTNPNDLSLPISIRSSARPILITHRPARKRRARSPSATIRRCRSRNCR